jgi:hypothetical protein
MRVFIERHPFGRWLTNFCLILVLLIGGFWYQGKATQAEDALCALRLNLEQQRVDSIKYLRDVREHKRKPIRGITETDITRNIRNTESTLRALENLDCAKSISPYPEE